MNSSTYRRAFEHASTPLWLEDIRNLRKELSEITYDGAEDLSTYLHANPQFVDRAASVIKVVDVNLATLRIFRVSDKSDVLGPLARILDLADSRTLDGIKNEIIAVASGQATVRRELRAVTPSGKRLNVFVTTQLFAEADAEPMMLLSSIETSEQRNVKRGPKAGQPRYRQLFDGMLDAFVMIGMDGRLIECNEAYQQMLGYNKDELTELNYRDITPEKWHSVEQRVINDQVLVRGYSDVFEKECRRKDGTVFPVEIKISLLSGDNGGPYGMWSAVRDITERKRLHQRLEEERSLLHMLIDNIPDYVYLKNHRAQFILANRALAEIVHAETPASLIGKTDYDFFSRKCADAFFADDMTVVQQEAPIVDKEEVSVSNHGVTRRVLTTKLPLRDDSGAVIGLVGFGHDITERREAEAKLRAFIEQSTEAIWIAGEDGIIIEFNGGAEQLTGIPRREAIGTPVWTLMNRVMLPERKSADFEARLEERIRELLVTGEADYLHKPVIATLRRADGTIRHIEDFYFAIQTSSGHQVGAISHDITAIQETREMLRQVEGQLHQAKKMEAVGQLAAGVAHDFNNILTSIMGYCSILRMHATKNDKSHTVIGDIMKAARRAAHVTEGLLIFSRKGQMMMQVVDLNEVVQQNLQFLRRLIGEDLDLVFTPWNGPVFVRADRAQIEQILMNLATNSRDAMAEDGTIRVRVEMEEIGHESKIVGAIPGSYAHLTFSDSGRGMDSKTQEKIFEPFFTTKAVGKGSGLGLSIVWGIVDQHRGHITAESEPGGGATFNIYFPVVTEPAAISENNEDLPTLRGNESLLVAEDEEMLRRLIRTILEGYGYTVIEAGDGNDALAQFDRNKDSIDLVLLDVVMPKMDGRLVFEEMKRQRPGLKAVFMSGYTPDLIESRGIRAEEIDIIHKPFTPVFLAQRVRKALDS